MSKFCENLLYYRKQAKTTQKGLAEKLGMTTNNIGHWEKGRTEPNIDTIIKLCEIFEISLEELLL